MTVTPPPGRCIVMVVDDDIDIRESVRDVLVDDGHHVVLAANGLEALAYLKSTAPLPGLILLDLGMPVMNGAEFREEQRLHPQWWEIPTVVITAAGDAENKARALRPNGVICKPFPVEVLLETVARYGGQAG